jgi:hypothetical protein
MAYYTADSFNVARKIWFDLSGSNNHVTDIGGTISVERDPGFVSYIKGGTSSWLRFPSTVLPSSYTLFHVARYNGNTKGRIFNGMQSVSNWLSGFHGGQAGVAYHSCWITPYTNIHNTDWMVASDRTSSFRSNGVERRRDGSNSCTSTVRLTINIDNYNENSDFAVRVILVYNRRLADSEVISVENWLMSNCYANENAAIGPISLPAPVPLRVSFFPTISG